MIKIEATKNFVSGLLGEHQLQRRPLDLLDNPGYEVGYWPYLIVLYLNTWTVSKKQYYKPIPCFSEPSDLCDHE